MGKTCPTCIDLVNGCDPIKTDNVIYSGPDLPCSTINTNDSLTLALQKIDDIICTFSGGGTNLSYLASPFDGVVLNSTGTDAIIPLADSINAGLLSPGDFIKIQDAHPPVTIGTPNGLSIVALTQELSLALADTSTTGALSFTDWNTFNNKQDAIINPITGLGTPNQLSKFGTPNSLVDSSVSDNGSLVTIANPTVISGIVNASSGLARGVRIITNEFATANNDVLVGLDITPTFNNGAFTGVTNSILRASWNSSFLRIGDINSGEVVFHSTNNTTNANYFLRSGLSSLVLNAPSLSGIVGVSMGNSTKAVFTATSGNLIIQNGGTFTDAGFRLDVADNTRLRGLLTLGTLPTTSVGTYDILTRNATTGVVEKITSTSVVGGSGTLNTIPKFTPNGTTLGNSSITDSGTGAGGIVDINNFIGGSVTRVLPSGNTSTGQTYNLTGADATSRLLNINTFNYNEDTFVNSSPFEGIGTTININKTTNQTNGLVGNNTRVRIDGIASLGASVGVKVGLLGAGTGIISSLSLFSGDIGTVLNTYTITNYFGFNLPFSPQNNVTNAYGVRIGELYGSTLSRGIDLGVSAGTGKFNVYAGGTANNYFNGNVLVGTTTNSGAKLIVGGTVNASGAISRGVYINTTNVATANNDVLVGLDIATTFTNGAFTGVKNYHINLQNNGIINGTNQINLSRGGVSVFGGFSVGTFIDTFNTSAPLDIRIGGSVKGTFFGTTGNFALQNGGTFTDDGINRLQVLGSIKSTALTLTTLPTTSAGTYDILTRNTGTGVIEKVAGAGVFELIANKQNSMAIDGTGVKYPTVDAVNFQTNYIARAVVATGFLDTTDPFSISRFDDFTLAISATQFGIAFSQRFKTLPFAPSDGIINIVAQNVPLSAIGLGVDGTYIRFVGIQIDGTIVWSPTQFIQSPSVCQLGLVLVKVVAGVTSFIDINRTAITMPDVAAYSNLDTTATGVKASTAIAAVPGTLSHSNIQGKLVGISVAWGTSNNDSKTIPLLNPTSFTRLHPGNALTVVPPATFTVMDPVNYWNGAALIAVPGGAGVSTVQRLLYTVNGNFVWQYGEATYANLVAAQNNILQALFTNILPEGTFAEVGRMAITKGCTDLASSNAQYYPTGQSGGGGTSPIAPTAWGAITGNIDDQLDLKAKLDARPTGSGTANTIPKFLTTTSIGNSSIVDTGTGVGGSVGINNFISGTVTRVLPAGATFAGQTFNITGTDATSQLLNRTTFNYNEDGFATGQLVANDIRVNVSKTTNTNAYTNLIFRSNQNGSGTISNFTGLSNEFGGTGTGVVTSMTVFCSNQIAFNNSYPITSYIGFNLPFTPQNNVTNSRGILIGDLFGSTISRGIDLGVTAGTGKYNIFAQGTASNHLLGNTLIGTTNNIGAKLNVDGTISASTGVGRVVNINGSLTATANNDILVGLDIAPTFNNGGFTGTTNFGVRIPIRSSLLVGSTNNGGRITFARGGDGASQGLVGYSSPTLNTDFGIFHGGGSSVIFLDATGAIDNRIGGIVQSKMFATGNQVWQNGGPFTDDGTNRLQVSGTVSSGTITLGDSQPVNNNQLTRKDYVDSKIPVNPVGRTGTAVAGQVAFWDSANSIAGDTTLTYDATTNILLLNLSVSNPPHIRVARSTNGNVTTPNFEPMLIYGETTHFNTGIYAGNSYSSNSGTLLKFVVNATTGVNTPVDAMVINSLGNVAIGPPLPTARLHTLSNDGVVYTPTNLVVNQVRLENVNNIGGTGTQSVLSLVASSNNGVNSSVASIIALQTTVASPETDLVFKLRVSSGSMLEVFRATSGGNVGIGVIPTTTATDKLQVNGNITASEATASNHVVVKSQADSGTFTPTSGGAFAYSLSYWVKVGNVVTFTVNVTTTLAGGTSSTTTLALPNGFNVVSPVANRMIGVSVAHSATLNAITGYTYISENTATNVNIGTVMEVNSTGAYRASVVFSVLVV